MYDIMSRRRFSQIKACLSVENPTMDQNAEEKLANNRPILEMMQIITRKYWGVGRDVGLD